MNVLDQVREVAADVFGIEVAQINADSSPSTIETWDSIQHLSLVLALESRFGVQIDPEDIEQFKSIGAAADIVGRKLRSA